MAKFDKQEKVLKQLSKSVSNQTTLHQKNNDECYTRREDIAVDHIKPWAEGGQTVIDNAQLLCKSHNSSKGKNL